MASARPRPRPLRRPAADLVVVGGGVVGCATARALAGAGPAVTLLEAEGRLAAHQSGHNSGVLHAGLYYAPGSLKARLCREGRADLLAFCAEQDLPHRITGKLVVAVDAAELPALDELARRAAANGLRGVRRLAPADWAGREPAVAGVAALLVPDTGIVDYAAVTAALASDAARRGADVRTDATLLAVREEPGRLVLETSDGVLTTRGLVACAGLQADRVARLCGLDPGLVVVPFRGEYQQLAAGREDLVRGPVYPVPDPAFPFLGVHFTPTLDGRVEIGPNAVPAGARHGYRRGAVDAADLAALVTWPGWWRLGRRLWRRGLTEWLTARSRRASLAAMRRLVPSLTAADVVPGGSGVRAQVVDRRGALVDDFRWARGPRSLHVLNAPSPAATASLAIGREVARRALTLLERPAP